MRTRSFWFHGLLLILALLGHDLLMANVAHATPVPSLATTTHQHGLADQPLTVDAASPHEDHQPDHPRDCSTTGAAVAGYGYQFDVIDLGVRAVAVDRALAAAVEPSAPRWQEPFWPPGTRRALLQVYRI